MLKRLALFCIDGPAFPLWLAACLAFVLAAQAGWGIADWLTPLVALPLAALVPIVLVSLLRTLLGR